MHQFNKFYYHRLITLKPYVKEAAICKFQKNLKLYISNLSKSKSKAATNTTNIKNLAYNSNILDIKPDQLTIIVGTLFKEQKKKACVFDKLESVIDNSGRDKITDEADYAIIEDTSGRIQVKQSELWDCNKHATGSIIAMLGVANQAGYFEVQDICYAGVPFKSEISHGLTDFNKLSLNSNMSVFDKSDR